MDVTGTSLFGDTIDLKVFVESNALFQIKVLQSSPWEYLKWKSTHYTESFLSRISFEIRFGFLGIFFQNRYFAESLVFLRRLVLKIISRNVKPRHNYVHIFLKFVFLYNQILTDSKFGFNTRQSEILHISFFERVTLFFKSWTKNS